MKKKAEITEKTETQERFENILGKLVSVSKKDIKKQEKLEKEKKKYGGEKEKKMSGRNKGKLRG